MYKQHSESIQSEQKFLRMLGVDEAQFSRIQKLSLRKEFLLYKVVKKEFEIIAKSQNSIAELTELHQAYESFINSDFCVNIKNPYSQYSLGLDQYFMRSVYNTRSIIDSKKIQDDDLEDTAIFVAP